MRPTEKKDIQFRSADGRSQVAGYLYHNPDAEPFCLLQISHGMREYMGRYDDFANFLAQRGVVVFGNDHIGHGATAAEPDDLGYFGEKGGRRAILLDIKKMSKKVRERYPRLPLVMFGHSMGSFFAREYAVLWPELVDGFLISGTSGTNKFAGLGIALTEVMMKTRGGRYRSKLVEGMAFGAYLNAIENPSTRYDWISHDIEVVKQYVADPLCNYRFTLSGFHEMFCALRAVSGPVWAARVPKETPWMFFSGEDDPVGEYGKGVRQVCGWLQDAEVQNVECHIYPAGRHEMLHEKNKEEVYEDVLSFLKRWYK